MYLFSPKFPSHPGCHIPLSRIPCALSRSLLVVHFKYSSSVHVSPRPLNYPLYPKQDWFLSDDFFLCRLVWSCKYVVFQFVSMWVTLILEYWTKDFCDYIHVLLYRVFFFFGNVFSWFLRVFFEGFSFSSVNKESACSTGDLGSIPGLGRSPGDGNGNPLQYPCLENLMDTGAWWAAVHGVAKSRARLSD